MYSSCSSSFSRLCRTVLEYLRLPNMQKLDSEHVLIVCCCTWFFKRLKDQVIIDKFFENETQKFLFKGTYCAMCTTVFLSFKNSIKQKAGFKPLFLVVQYFAKNRCWNIRYVDQFTLIWLLFCSTPFTCVFPGLALTVVSRCIIIYVFEFSCGTYSNLRWNSLEMGTQWFILRCVLNIHVEQHQCELSTV